MMIHRPPPELLQGAVRVLVVGCGGTGSAIASGLPYLHQAMLARGHSAGLAVTLQDGDTISPANCVRQPFCRGEVGHNKAVVMATRQNLFWGFAWKAVPTHLTATTRIEADIVIGCVDSRAARAVISRAITISPTVRYWLDLGNSASDGQFVLGEPPRPLNRPDRLPTAAELWPEIVDEKVPAVDDGPSCSAAEAIMRQEPFVNQVLAQHALALLTRFFAGSLAHHGAFVNLATGKVSPMPVPAPLPVGPAPESPRRNGGAGSRRARRRGAAAAAAVGGA